uniref:B229_C3_226 n=1 Tax=Mycobacterium leprae TaxID=1769 RepID=Q49867_MYCLR|nr:B229_C3_226 [Mycobacterium leprae]
MDRCEGNTVCLGRTSDVFDLDDEDYAVVRTDPVSSDQEVRAEQAIAECLRAALLRQDLLETRDLHKLTRAKCFGFLPSDPNSV